MLFFSCCPFQISSHMWQLMSEDGSELWDSLHRPLSLSRDPIFYPSHVPPPPPSISSSISLIFWFGSVYLSSNLNMKPDQSVYFAPISFAQAYEQETFDIKGIGGSSEILVGNCWGQKRTQKSGKRHRKGKRKVRMKGRRRERRETEKARRRWRRKVESRKRRSRGSKSVLYWNLSEWSVWFRLKL